jgi:hypothetical protein
MKLPISEQARRHLGATAPALVRGYCPHPSNHLAFGFTACQMTIIITDPGENCDPGREKKRAGSFFPSNVPGWRLTVEHSVAVQFEI